LIERIVASAAVAAKANLTFCLVMEDTTRTPPDVLREVFAAGIQAGATRLCLCDTVGHSDWRGAKHLVDFARETTAALGAPNIELDWHGHNDRGLALINALEAARAGVDHVHATAGGIGERCGNVQMEHLVEQLAVLGVRPAVSESAMDTYRRVAVPERPGPISVTPPEPTMPVRIRINGESRTLNVRPSRTLLEVLRYDLDLIGTKQGCDEGDCGACTVLVDGEPTLSCLTLAASCNDRDVVTVEALSGAPSLDPLLDAFDRTGAGQCGFCTPGMLMSAKALLARDPRPSRQSIRQAISGNLCRCTGYGPIVDAIEIAAGTRQIDDVPLPGQGPLPQPLPPYVSRKK
jgi:2-isopropylmalate synthase